jgi:predicted Rossmann fold flavoprotein
VPSHSPHIVIAGGGAAGIFAAITAAESGPARVTVLEQGPRFLSKVLISGGGRCNVTHACFDPRELSLRYPRGGRALLGAFHQFQPRDTIAWFAARGVTLKTEADGRMFPITDSSATIADCLLEAARRAGVELRPNCALKSVERTPEGGFTVHFGQNEKKTCDRLMLATGGCRAANAGILAVSLGHTLEPPVPSLFTFRIASPWLRQLAGISLPEAEIQVKDENLKERGPILITHEGLSGPAVLRLSAWGARALHNREYRFSVLLNWVPQFNLDSLGKELQKKRQAQPARSVVNSPMSPLPARLWEQLVLQSGIARETRWADLSRAQTHQFLQTLSRTELQVIGKSLNRDEFVTCGGIPLNEVNFKTMESRICPGLFFGGELLDIDGVTGGFNFQAAWTTGWLAGRAMAGAPK